MSRQTAYAATALGVGLALFMPLQIASSLTRAVGARLSGDATMLRGGAASLFEQAFDVAVYACLMIAALATVQIGGGGGAWAAFALSFLLMAWAGAGRGLVFLRQSLNWTAARLDKMTWLRRVSESISESGFLGPALARRLLLLSVFRYLLLGMMSAAVAPAVGLDIPAWKVMAALPFAALAAAVSPTPSGLGLLDWAFASGLMMFGTPVDIAVQWALVNRLLMSAHSLFVALTGGLCALFVQRSG